jgi:hypothetical protein
VRRCENERVRKREDARMRGCLKVKDLILIVVNYKKLGYPILDRQCRNVE